MSPVSTVWADLLLVGGHESVAGDDPLGNLRVVHLVEEGLLLVLRVPLLGHPVPGPSNLHKLLDVHSGLNKGRCRIVFFILNGPFSSFYEQFAVVLRNNVGNFGMLAFNFLQIKVAIKTELVLQILQHYPVPVPVPQDICLVLKLLSAEESRYYR